ncbi:MAG: response regulator transcription factor [Fusobacteriota bacterium]
MSILLVEDDEIILEIEKTILEEYELLTSKNYLKALEIIEKENPELIILDINLEGRKNGFDLIRKIRAEREIFGNPMVLFLTKLSDIKFVKKGLRLGGDDYLKKPFDYEEFKLRVKSLLRKKNIETDIYKYFDLVLDLKNNTLKYGKKEIELSMLEFNILAYCIKNRGMVLSRDKIYEKVWGGELKKGNRIVDVNITRLRNKIDFLKDKIETVRGLGYKLKNKK